MLSTLQSTTATMVKDMIYNWTLYNRRDIQIDGHYVKRGNYYDTESKVQGILTGEDQF